MFSVCIMISYFLCSVFLAPLVGFNKASRESVMFVSLGLVRSWTLQGRRASMNINKLIIRHHRVHFYGDGVIEDTGLSNYFGKILKMPYISGLFELLCCHAQ